jgi:transposase
VGCQKFCKLLNALRVIVFHPSSSTQHNNMAPTIERSQLARSRARGRSLTSFERGQIVQAYGDGYTLESIADQFQRAPSTISRTIHGVSQHNEGSERPRTRRPRTSTPRDQRRLENAVKRYPFWSYKKIARLYRFSWNISTMRRMLGPFGIKKWLAKKRPLLTKETAAKRYK